MARVFISRFHCFCPLGKDARIGERLTHAENALPVFQRSQIMPDTLCAPIADFDSTAAIGQWRHRKYLNRGALFALSAALCTCPDPIPDSDLICAIGPNLDMPTVFPPEQDALWILRYLPNTMSSAIAQRLGIHGEALVVGNACAAGLQALGEGARRIQTGSAHTVLVAAGDSRLSYGALQGYRMAHALHSPFPEQAAVQDANAVMRPFDRCRNGFAPGEGGAAFMLESEEQLRARKAMPLAEILGFGGSLDAGSLTAPDPEARWALRASQKALNAVGAAGQSIDWIAAHGTSTPLNDAAEALLIEKLFSVSPAITALKSWIGHLGAACGAVELALMLHAAQANILPVIRNLEEPCSAQLDFIREPRPFFTGAHSTGLMHSFGFGGHNAALVVRMFRNPTDWEQS